MLWNWSKTDAASRSWSAARVAGAGAALALFTLPACGGGGGGGSKGGNSGNDLTDPVIPLVGPTGTYSQTPEEANASLGLSPPPTLPTSTSGAQNQFLRLEVPFDVVRSSILSTDPLLAPFSFLNGNISIVDEVGNHLPCVICVNGFDAQGRDRRQDAGFPQDIAASGRNLNVGPGVILFIADDDGTLATPGAFGGTTTDTDLSSTTTEILSIRLAVNAINGTPIRGFYTVNVNQSGVGDNLQPIVQSVVAEIPNPLDPGNVGSADSRSRFIVRFSEPCVPSTVGSSSELDPLPFDGNMPFLNSPGAPPTPPLPNLHITAELRGTSTAPLYIPCDVNPLNSNNLATYVVTPLIDLPPEATIDLVVVDANGNRDPLTTLQSGAQDLSGNFHIGTDVVTNFSIGPGRVPVNAPVSPEVIYVLPQGSRGIAAIDLNGMGFTTNAPGANSDKRERAAMITKVTLGGYNVNFEDAQGWRGIPENRRHNSYDYPRGTGSWTYGRNSPNTPDWPASEAGNTGTPIPGLNEMSTGYEMLVRDAEGDFILTGRKNSEVGRVLDMAVGQFLDAAIFDTQNAFADQSFHVSYFWGAGLNNNSIGEPPSPNPPPLRYWNGLQPVDILINQNAPGEKARLIEGEEVWAGDRSGGGISYQWVIPNPDPTGFDKAPPGQLFVPNPAGNPPFFTIGPGPTPQSGSSLVAFRARQQIGNYLYVVDSENSAVHALNSNTMRVIDTFPLPDPLGVTVSADLRFFCVTNAGDDTVSIFGADPTLPDFHTEISRVRVGTGPGPIAAQPDGEDLHVANTGDNTVSIVDLGSLTVRKTFDTLISGPVDIVLSPRQGGFGWVSGVYYGYISNFAGNTVLVYESGPAGPQGIGCDNILGALPTDSGSEDIVEPRGLCYSPYPNSLGLLAGGCYIAHRDQEGRGVISRIENSAQAILGPLPCNPPPGGNFFIPPGFTVKIFEITGQWGVVNDSRLFGDSPSSVVLADFRRSAYMQVPSTAPNWTDRGFAPTATSGPNHKHPVRQIQPPDPRAGFIPTSEPERMYVSFNDTGRVQVLDPTRIGISLGEIGEQIPEPVRKLYTYFE